MMYVSSTFSLLQILQKSFSMHSLISRSERALAWWEGIKGVSLLLPPFSLDNTAIYLDRSRIILVPGTNLLTLGVANFLPLTG